MVLTVVNHLSWKLSLLFFVILIYDLKNTAVALSRPGIFIRLFFSVFLNADQTKYFSPDFHSNLFQQKHFWSMHYRNGEFNLKKVKCNIRSKNKAYEEKCWTVLASSTSSSACNSQCFKWYGKWQLCLILYRSNTVVSCIYIYSTCIS